MTERSESWDKKENEMGKVSPFPPKIKKVMVEALVIYREHHPTHNWIKIMIRGDGKIMKFECGECKWDHLKKKQWKFWN